MFNDCTDGTGKCRLRIRVPFALNTSDEVRREIRIFEAKDWTAAHANDIGDVVLWTDLANKAGKLSCGVGSTAFNVQKVRFALYAGAVVVAVVSDASVNGINWESRHQER